MTLDDLELYKFEFSENFSEFRRFRTQQQLNEWSIVRDNVCKHVELEQFLACFRVAPVCQRQLGFLVMHAGIEYLGPERTGWTDRTRPTPPAANSQPKIHTKAIATGAASHPPVTYSATQCPDPLAGFTGRGEGREY